MPTERWPRRGLWWTAAVLSLVFVLGSIAWMVADMAAFRARAWAETWDNLVLQSARKGKYYEPAEQDWQAARRQAALAVQLAPFNVGYREIMARVHGSRFPMADVADPRAMPFLEAAADHYREAIRQRPTWPHTYMALARTLRHMGRLDDEYENSLRQALHYGPWEPSVLLMVADLNVDILPLLRPTTRQLVLDTLARGLAWNHDAKEGRMPYGDQLWARIVARRKQMVVCGWLPMTDPAIRARCTVQAR